MSAQRYLEKARDRLAAVEAPATSSTCERSEKSERSRRFAPGGRYEVKGPVLGIIHRSTREFDDWRAEMRLPRAGLMTIQGELVVVADVRAAMKSGFIEVVATLVEALE